MSGADLIAVGVVLVLAITAVGGYLLYRPQSQVQVPNLVGMTPAEAEAQLRKAELNLHVTYDEVADQPVGTVSRTDPPTGAKLDRGAQVTLFVAAARSASSPPRDLANAPGQPYVPAQPAGPGQPYGPGQPAAPGQPYGPGQPAVPGQSVVPARPPTSARLAAPALPTTPARSTAPTRPKRPPVSPFTGTLSVPENSSTNLDPEQGSNPDIYYGYDEEGSRIIRSADPVNAVRYIGRPGRLTKEDCMTFGGPEYRSFKTEHLTKDDVICFTTNSQRISAVRLDQDPQSSPWHLPITFVTWP